MVNKTMDQLNGQRKSCGLLNMYVHRFYGASSASPFLTCPACYFNFLNPNHYQPLQTHSVESKKTFRGNKISKNTKQFHSGRLSIEIRSLHVL